MSMLMSTSLLLSLSLLPVLPSRDGCNESVINIRDFLLPVAVKADRKGEIESIIFHVSTDRGRTWSKAGTISPSDEGLPFHAKDDGDYWFTLQVVDKRGEKWPATVAEKGAPVSKVRVATRYKMPYAD